MVKIHLSTLMGKSRMTQKDVSVATGINIMTINKYYHETIVRIDISHISALCKLFNCKIQDLIEYIPEGDSE